MLSHDQAGNLFDEAGRCLAEPDPSTKQRLTEHVAAAWQQGRLRLDPAAAGPVVELPGRPERPELVPPRRLDRRKLTSPAGRAALIHAVAHIEFNAINLAWDAVQRFRDMPVAFYSDWVQVATEEAYHFALMSDRLREAGYEYGAFPAHDGLWQMARATAHDPLVRMALVPRVLEARGLDVTPGMIERLLEVGDVRTAECLRIILRDEVGHVAAGSRWFRYLCDQRGRDPEQAYFDLLDEHLAGQVRCPLNLPDRRRAGFGDGELKRLESLCRERG